ncbi:PTS system fructose-specific IIC component [Sporomusaceae bacterium BoRhaA]|uniref:PTS fructose transporter subunit IIC n=1 Tax=Pelorhabdus rhamnosifermentans TaxID=2772457 RepID=UPI001C0642D7|nr:PTS fructose transporter subunit IIBC [Pelorhabdus rhamnosifermentans]MBU2699738.1 PTS system fructose-specific IIC component [Pelorhabdus rhamnosifermentans]
MKKLLGVTGCITGIAHTFMAAEALKKAAEAAGVQIKVETNGAIGVEDALTAEEIKEADCIIVASDKQVDMERLNGKPVIEVPVAKGIQHAAELVQEAMSGNVAIRGGKTVNNGIFRIEEKPGMGNAIYKHLMSGVSHMIPFVVAGGVLIAISFLWGIYSFDPTSDQYNPTAALLKQIGGYSMGLMVPILTAYIAQSIADRPGLVAGFVAGTIATATGSGFIGGILGGFLAGYVAFFLIKSMSGLPKQFEGLKSIFLVPLVSVVVVGVVMYLLADPVATINASMMSFLSNLQNSNPIILGIVIGCMSAFDMGGPVNKAAYVTGTLLLGQGNYYFMAGVSAACITPPILVAISTTIFKNKFTKDERAAGLVNYILGCTHITEGAIPFAAKSPLTVIPILMLGSSISAVLTYIMKVQVPAPHGGFLILALVDQPLTWVLCILAGSVVGAVIYGVTRKMVAED